MKIVHVVSATVATVALVFGVLSQNQSARQWLVSSLLLHKGEDMIKGTRKYKAPVFNGVSGDILEIGAGAGVNFEFFSNISSYVAVEPNLYFHQKLRENALGAGIPGSYD